jgi:hypothetical protein
MWLYVALVCNIACTMVHAILVFLILGVRSDFLASFEPASD